MIKKRRELVEQLWIKHCYLTNNGNYTSNKDLISEDYEKVTGEKLPKNILNNDIQRLDRESLYLKKTFNQRTDEIIDAPAKAYTPSDLIEAMGASPDHFEMVDTTLNKWWLDKGDILERIRNGQIKIRIKPKQFKVDENVLDRLVNKNREEVYIEADINDPYGMFEMTLTDLHFGKNTYEHYKPHQKRIMRWIRSQEWEEILLPIGNDLFHWDNFLGTTTAGTQVGFEPDLDKAWEDALRFYIPIIELCLEHALNVYMPYVPGNHDETLGWAFVKMLAKDYPQIISDTDNENYKIHTWEKIAVGLSHGNTPRQFTKYAPIYNELFRKEFAEAEIREIHLGDKHHQMLDDSYGIVTRGLSTASVNDKWHHNSGYIGSSKVFQCFIYSKSRIEAQLFI